MVCSARSPSRRARCRGCCNSCSRSAISRRVSLGGVWLYYYLIRRAAATRVVSLFYLTPPIDRAKKKKKKKKKKKRGGGTSLVNWRPLALFRLGDCLRLPGFARLGARQNGGLRRRSIGGGSLFMWRYTALVTLLSVVFYTYAVALAWRGSGRNPPSWRRRRAAIRNSQTHLPGADEHPRWVAYLSLFLLAVRFLCRRYRRRSAGPRLDRGSHSSIW